MGLNKVILMGRLCAAPELKQGQTGTNLTGFRLAVDGFNKESKADFFSVKVFGKTAEFVCRYFKKGDQIALVGELHQSNWTDKNGAARSEVEVIAREVFFTASKMADASPAQNEAPAYGYEAPPNFESIPQDGDLPF